jgi:RHS repeat-associated protein
MSATAPSQTVFSIGYDFHVGNGISGADSGNVWNIYNYRDRSRDQNFTYDLLNRLTSAQNAGTNCAAITVNGKTEYWGNSYGYDAWGNLTSKTITKCGAELLNAPALVNNQLSGYGYYAAGNMTSDPTDNVTASYDAENRIASASTASGTFTYTYDADGNRVEKSGGGAGTLYWYMTPGIVAESDIAGNLKSEYVFFNGDRVARRDYPSGSVAYYFSDHLKTASVITDSAGNIKAESDGELQFVNNDSNHYKFTGKERDSESGLDYFGARYYSNGLGRFITPDWAAKAVDVPYAEFADPQSLNLYSYVRNIPTAKADPDGHEIPVDPKDINIERVATFLKNFADAAASVYQDINDPLNRAAAQMCGCNKSGYYDVGNREAEDDTKNSNHSFRQTEQGRDAQGKWVSKNPGEAAPGAQAEREALDAVGATKNTEAIPGSNRIPDGRIENASGKVEQYVEGKSGASVSNTKQLREMARAAMKATGNRLKLVTTNPNVKIAKPVLQNEDIEIVKLNQK